MSLSREELETLIRLVGQTRDAEIDCDQCLTLIAEFAEQRLAGRSLSEGLQAVAQHLSVCSECQSEYLALQRVLSDWDDGKDGPLP